MQLKNQDGENAIYILKMDTFPALNNQLEAKLTPISFWAVKVTKYLLLKEDDLHEGKYSISENISALQFVRNIRNGHQSEVKLVISKSRSFLNFATKIKQSIHISSNNLNVVLDSLSLIDSNSRKNIPQSYLALIIPESHRIYWNCSNRDLYRKLKSAYLKFWNQSRIEKAAQIGLSRYQIMVLASIVEEETSVDLDKPRIAAVYYNRLKKGMRLQADPTIIFALQDYSIHRVLNKHLDINSPFNTYRISGLPPAPICIPSLASIESVLNMPHTSDLYFCADPSFNGRHIFTSNYTEHLKNAHAYQDAFGKRFGK